MTDSFPRQAARTIGFSLGAPRSFHLSPDGQAVIFLRSKAGTDPVTCLFALDVATGEERMIADPLQIGKAGAEDDPIEKARRERVRERAAGIVAFGTDRNAEMATFALAGTVYLADLKAGGGVRELSTATPAADPRPDPTGRFVAYVSDGVLRIHEIATGADWALADPEAADGISFGLAEFIAAEEMERSRGYWWAPDGSAILTARVDETPVQFWHIADPANPERPARAVRYPAAGTPNADVSLYIARLDGGLTAGPLGFGGPALPGHSGMGGCRPAPDRRGQPGPEGHAHSRRPSGNRGNHPRAGRHRPVLGRHHDRGPRHDGRWPDRLDRRHGRREAPAGRDGRRACGRNGRDPDPEEMNVRAVLSVDGDTILFSASGADPASMSVWTAGPGGLAQVSPADGVYDGQLAGGTLLLTSRTLAGSGCQCAGTAHRTRRRAG